MTDNQNPFKRLELVNEVPKELKEKVMRDVNYIRFFTDIADLISMKYLETVQNLFTTETGKEQNKLSQNGNPGENKTL